MPQPNCPLCSTEIELFSKGRVGEYYKCAKCFGISLGHKYLPSPEQELTRYQKHESNVEDEGYQKFVSPIVDKIRENFSTEAKGLDFGSGPNSIIKYLLKGFNLDLYDPYFIDDQTIFEKQYDYISCCEVMEHFHKPAMEFKRLYSMLKPGGKLICMTELCTDMVDFETWSYKNDMTHVFFYHPNTIKYVQENFGFSNYRIENRLICLQK